MLNRIKNYTFNLGAIAITLGATAIAVSPSLAQTTSVPITGGNFSVNVTSAGAVTSNPNGITVLTPSGTAQITSLTGTTPTTTPLSANGVFDIQGTSTNGSVNFDDGRTANFTNAQSTIKGEISKVNGAAPVGTTVSSLASPATVEGSIKTGSSIQVPTSSISALPANTVIVPIVGGTFDVVRFASTSVVNNNPTTVLTPYGTAQLTKFEYATLDNLNGTSVFNVNDEVRGTASASGSIPNKVSPFTNAKAAVVGTVATTTTNSNGSVNLKGNITSGNFIVPASSATTLPSISNETIILLLNNRQLFKLVGLSPSLLAPGQNKFLLLLVNNQGLLNYVNSKSSDLESSDLVSFGDRSAVDKLVFVNLNKKNLYYFSEVSFQALVTALRNSTSTSTSTTATTTTGSTTTASTSTQVVKVVFVGLPSRLIPGFGMKAKIQRGDKD